MNSHQHSIHPLVREYALRHGLGGSGTNPTFFTQFNDHEALRSLPFMHEIKPAALRILQALKNHDRVCVYCDYDTDAVTAGAVMYWGLLSLGFDKAKVTFYTPDRFSEGYGINQTALTKLAECNDLIISVDCGINSVKEVEAVLQIPRENQATCDIIITDHHQLAGQIPPAFAVVNPQLSSQDHEPLVGARSQALKEQWERLDHYNDINIEQQTAMLSQSVTGVGVAWFVLVWTLYLARILGLSETQPSTLNILLPFVAIGTIADCQSILDATNRSLVKAGLLLFNRKKYQGQGLGELLRQTGFLDKIDAGYVMGSQDLAYVLSPILNASGRMTHASHSLALLTYNDGHIPISSVFEDQYANTSASTLANELIAVNEERKQMIKNIIKDIEDQVTIQIDAGEPVVWIEGPWSKGVIGLIASRIVTTSARPVIVFSTLDEDKWSASLRAPKGYNLAQAISQCSNHLSAGGGHPGAAGLSLKPDNKDKFKVDFLECILKQEKNLTHGLGVGDDEKGEWLKSALFSNNPEIIASINPQECIILDDDSELEEIAKSIYYLEPFGQHFTQPKILVRGVLSGARLIGKDSNHLKGMIGSLGVTQFYCTNEVLEFVRDANQSAYQRGDSYGSGYNTLSPIEMTLLLKPSYNTWNGVTKLELIAEKLWIEDLKTSVIS